MPIHHSLAAAALGLACAGHLGAAQDTAAPQEKASPALLHVRAALLVLPGTPAEALGDGCWVRFYDGTDFTGASATLVGPGELPRMSTSAPYWRAWDSAEVGPRAQVTTFDDPELRTPTTRLEPGARVADLRERTPGGMDEVQSARVSC